MVHVEVLRSKIARIQKYLDRIASKRPTGLGPFLASPDLQDIVLHNLQNAIQGAIDMASHIISDEGWGIPGTQSEIFRLMKDKGLLKEGLAKKMVAMVGFRNLIVHEYGEIDLKIVHRILKKDSKDIAAFIGAISRRFEL